MKKYMLTTVMLIASAFLFGQGGFKKNDIYFEAGGNGLFSSVNYERQLTKEPGIGARIGIGFYSENAFYLTIPAGIDYLFRLGNHGAFVDAALGVTWTQTDGRLFGRMKDSREEHFVNFIPGIGFRKHTANNLMWRIGITPVANRYGLVPWLGISTGKRF